VLLKINRIERQTSGLEQVVGVIIPKLKAQLTG